jgi:hypothetical protein
MDRNVQSRREHLRVTALKVAAMAHGQQLAN